ncbi:MAG: imidazole glycerol phosphate synthase subunit HisH [Actinobacteria bacterium]|nr:imidazole glycerol phosphate synthase subunit HisH [Actinomycetota bacterium]
MIGVVDYRAGNAPSVGYALARLGIEHQLVTTPDQIAAAERIILPGVGAAKATLASLGESELIDSLATKVVTDRAPFLGICIGLQVLFDHSEEGNTPCLGWIPGQVKQFPLTARVPQIGWNSVQLRRDHPVTADFPDGGHCYFVNSYYAAPADTADVLGSTEYELDFCSIAAHDNIVATQFHAEKSGPLGLSLLRAFAGWDPQC